MKTILLSIAIIFLPYSLYASTLDGIIASRDLGYWFRLEQSGKSTLILYRHNLVSTWSNLTHLVWSAEENCPDLWKLHGKENSEWWEWEKYGIQCTMETYFSQGHFTIVPTTNKRFFLIREQGYELWWIQLFDIRSKKSLDLGMADEAISIKNGVSGIYFVVNKSFSDTCSSEIYLLNRYNDFIKQDDLCELEKKNYSNPYVKIFSFSLGVRKLILEYGVADGYVSDEKLIKKEWTLKVKLK